MAAQIDPEAVVCRDATLAGDVRVGPGTVVHPKAVVRALGGPIVLGANNLVEENAELVNRISDFSTGRSTEPMVIGDGNRFGTGCVIDSSRIGDRNTFEERVKVGPDCNVGNDCVVVATRSVAPGTALADRMVVYGGRGEANVQSATEVEGAAAVHAQHVQYLAEVLPTYHDLQGRPAEGASSS